MLALRYVTKLKFLISREDFSHLQTRLRSFGLVIPWKEIVEIQLEKDDPRQAKIEKEITRFGPPPLVTYEPIFDISEVESAEFLQLRIKGECGASLSDQAEELGLPSGVRAIRWQELGNRDIVQYHTFEVVISDRLRMILQNEGMSGWLAQLLEGKDTDGASRPRVFEFTVTNVLPRLASVTDLHKEQHPKPLTWPLGHPLHGMPDPLHGTVGLFQRGPLVYLRSAMTIVSDFNLTCELFGEATLRHHEMIISNRCWQVLRRHSVESIDVEPVVILDRSPKTGGSGKSLLPSF